jgi:toxin HigB-1
VIRSFGDAAMADVYYGRDTEAARRLPKPLWPVIRRKLDALHRAQTLADLRLPAGNRLEALKGDQAGRYSVRVNAQYRITFRAGRRRMPTRSRAKTTTDGPRSVLDLKRPPTPPGEMLLKEFLRPAGLTQVEAARRMGMPLNRLNEIIRGRRGAEDRRDVGEALACRGAVARRVGHPDAHRLATSLARTARVLAPRTCRIRRRSVRPSRPGRARLSEYPGARRPA